MPERVVVSVLWGLQKINGIRVSPRRGVWLGAKIREFAGVARGRKLILTLSELRLRGRCGGSERISVSEAKRNECPGKPHPQLRSTITQTGLILTCSIRVAPKKNNEIERERKKNRISFILPKTERGLYPEKDSVKLSSNIIISWGSGAPKHG